LKVGKTTFNLVTFNLQPKQTFNPNKLSTLENYLYQHWRGLW